MTKTQPGYALGGDLSRGTSKSKDTTVRPGSAGLAGGKQATVSCREEMQRCIRETGRAASDVWPAALGLHMDACVFPRVFVLVALETMVWAHFCFNVFLFVFDM